MILWERITEQKLRHEINVSKNQFVYAKKIYNGTYIHF